MLYAVRRKERQKSRVTERSHVVRIFEFNRGKVFFGHASISQYLILPKFRFISRLLYTALGAHAVQFEESITGQISCMTLLCYVSFSQPSTAKLTFLRPFDSKLQYLKVSTTHLFQRKIQRINSDWFESNSLY